MKSLSKPGAIMHYFETQFSLQRAFHGKLALSVCSNGACEAIDKAGFFIRGGAVGGTRYEALRF